MVVFLIRSFAYIAAIVALSACSNAQLNAINNMPGHINGHSITLYNEAVRLDKMGDCDAAIRDFRESANLGNIKSMLRMGAAYAIGHCVLTDKTLAKRWIRRAYNRARETGDDQDRQSASYIYNRFQLWKY